MKNHSEVAAESRASLIEKLRQIESAKLGDPMPECLRVPMVAAGEIYEGERVEISTGVNDWATPLSKLAGQAADALERCPVVSIKPMALSDGSTDYFVSIMVGDREITPYKLREEWQAAYEADSFRWLLLGAEQPDILAYGPEGWPRAASSEHARSKP